MRQYELKEQKEISKMIVINVKKKFRYPADMRWKVFRVDYEWGISLKKTGKALLDLCEACYDKLLRSFQIPV